jgi:hypothetical protein
MRRATLMCWLSGNLGASNSWNPQGLSIPVNVRRSSYKMLLYLNLNLMDGLISVLHLPIQTFTKICLARAEQFLANGRTNIQIGVTNIRVIVAFRSFTNAPKFAYS